MNFRTTFYLAIVLAVLALGYLVLRPELERAGDTAPAPPRDLRASPVAQDLVEVEPDKVVKVVCRRSGEQEWVFEKGAGDEATGAERWRMTAPREMDVARNDVEAIVRQITGLQYELGFRPGEAGSVTAAAAGLDPPGATVRLVTAEGQGVAVEIGKPASDHSTYVRLADREEVFVAMSSLRDLLKDSPLEYRDRQLWTFAPEKAKRIQIDDRSDPESPVTYVLAHETGRWMLQAPVTARATGKVDDMVRAMSQLRAVNWEDDRPERLAAYGLDPSAWTIRLTVEEETPKKAEQAEESAEPQEPDTPSPPVEKTYELHLSDRSPIGEDTKVYVRVGDETMVATVMKYTADNLKPAMSEWREMKVTTADVVGATRIELVTTEAQAALVKSGDHWLFEEDDSPAEEEVVRELLEAVRDLRAVVFVDGEAPDLASYGLDAPQAEIRLTVPGLEEIERIAVGGYSDAATKRLAFVRRNEVASIAKVRSADVERLTRSVRDYRDRTIMDVPAKQFRRITLTRKEACTGRPMTVTLERAEEDWSMTAPVAAAVRSERLNPLIDALSELRADSIVAESGERTAYGLHEPAASVVVEFAAPESGAEEGSEDAEPESATTSLTVHVADHDGRYYAMREDRPAIFEVPASLYQQFVAEYRIGDVLEFDEGKVRQLSIRTGAEPFVFQRTADKWSYQAEPDLPLDHKKVDNLLLQLKDLDTERWVEYGMEDESAFGLSSAKAEVTITLEDGSSQSLVVAERPCVGRPGDGWYATVSGRGDVFLLTTDQLVRFEVRLAELERGP